MYLYHHIVVIFFGSLICPDTPRENSAQIARAEATCTHKNCQEKPPSTIIWRNTNKWVQIQWCRSTSQICATVVLQVARVTCFSPSLSVETSCLECKAWPLATTTRLASPGKVTLVSNARSRITGWICVVFVTTSKGTEKQNCPGGSNLNCCHCHCNSSKWVKLNWQFFKLTVKCRQDRTGHPRSILRGQPHVQLPLFPNHLEQI